MRHWDSFAVVDWSSGNDRGLRPKADAIWAGAVVCGVEQAPVYLRNRTVAEKWIADHIERERSAGRRLLIGFDFPFGYPAGFAETVTGSPDPLRLWDWFAAHLEDLPRGNNRFNLAGRLNALFSGVGPFWFNGTKTEVPHLPRKGTARDGHGMPERRAVEVQARGAFPCWQMGGAGAVGGQAMTGMAALSRLRARFPDEIAVWPFERLDRGVAFVEIWPSLIAGRVAAEGDEIKDRAQVRLLSRALSRLPAERLEEMLSVEAAEEGWILGLGYEEELAEAAGVPCPV